MKSVGTAGKYVGRWSRTAFSSISTSYFGMRICIPPSHVAAIRPTVNP